MRSARISNSPVIRRVGGLEVQKLFLKTRKIVIRRVGGLKMFHHAHFSRSSAILPPGHWLLIQYMTSANSLRLKMREKRRSPVLTLCRLCGQVLCASMSVLSWMFCPRHCYRSTGGVLFFDGAAGLTLCAFATPPAARESPIAWQRLSLPTHPNVNVYRSSLPAIFVVLLVACE